MSSVSIWVLWEGGWVILVVLRQPWRLSGQGGEGTRCPFSLGGLGIPLLALSGRGAGSHGKGSLPFPPVMTRSSFCPKRTSSSSRRRTPRTPLSTPSSPHRGEHSALVAWRSLGLGGSYRGGRGSWGC